MKKRADGIDMTEGPKIVDPRSSELVEQHNLQEDQMVLKVYQVLNTINRSRYTFDDARGIVNRRSEIRKALGL